MIEQPDHPEAQGGMSGGASADDPEIRPQGGEGMPGSTGQDPFAVLEALNVENASLKDKLLRSLADMENLRRRTEKEITDARAYGVTSFARDVLTVSDNINRAVETVPAEERARGDGAFKALIEGIQLTERDLLKTLERHGVRKIDPKGERFDPNQHQAMFEVPDGSVPNGTVVQVVQAGFVIGERVLRPALVGVSKGGPKPPPAQAETADGDGGAYPGA